MTTNPKPIHLVPFAENDSPANATDVDRILNELNLLKLEGCHFCFDPKKAAQPTSHTLKLEQIERFQEIVKRPATIELNPAYGQPSIIAYKVLQTVFRKVMEGADLRSGFVQSA